MIFNDRRAALGGAIAAALAAIAVAAPAQANVQIPGLNGKIAFTTERDFPFGETAAPDLRGSPASCFSGQGCSDEIYSIDPNGANPTRLTNNLATDDEAAWLPADGAAIAFESNRAHACTFEDTTCNFDLWSMKQDGATPGQLTNDSSDDLHPSYSPDGSKIAYYAEPQESQITVKNGRLILISPSQVMIIPAGGEAIGAPTPLLPPDQVGEIAPDTFTADGLPAWSPDGTKIAFTRASETIIPDPPPPPPKGVEPVPTGFTITLDERTYVAPAGGGGPATPIETYAPCSFHITNDSVAADVFNATRASLRTGRAPQSRLFGPGCTFDIKPAWSPDGSKIAVSRLSSGEALKVPEASTRGFPGFDPGDIVVFNSANGSGEVNLSNASEPGDCDTGGSTICSDDEYPTWSPDGTKLVFYSDRDSSGGRPEECSGPMGCDDEIWTMNADGSGLAQLTNNDVDDFDPDWQRIPPPPPPVTPVIPAKPTVGVAGVRRACVSSSFHVRLRVGTTASVKSVVVKLDGKRLKSTNKGSFTLSINPKKLKAGRHRLTITVTDSAGQTVTSRKSFSVCKAAKPRRRSAPRFTG
jgi:Tol biopolymer transport system component